MAETSTETKSIKELTRTVQAENEKTRGKLERAAELEVMSKDEIKELKKVAKGNGEEAQQADKKLRAELNKIANKKEAIKSLEKADQQLALQGRISGLSEKRLQKAEVLNGVIGKQKEIMEAQKAELASLGIKAEGNKKFQKEEMKLARAELARAKMTGSKQAEEEAKKKIYELRSNTYLGTIANGITDIRKSAKEKLKTGAKCLLTTSAFGGFAIAAIAFLNSPYFEKTRKYIRNEIIPAIGRFYESMKETLPEIIDSIKSFYQRLKNGTKPLIELFTGAKDKEGNPIGLFDRVTAVFNKDSALVAGLGAIAIGFTAVKIAKKLAPLKGAVSKLFGGLGTLAKKIPGIPGGGKAGGVLSKIGDSTSKTASGIGAKIKSMGKGLGGFISGLLKGIATGLSAFANPKALVGLLAMAAAFLALAAAVRIMGAENNKAIGQLFKDLGKGVKEAFNGVANIVRSVGDTVGKVIDSMGKSIQDVLDTITKMKTAGTEATTKQIKELSKIPADTLFAAARGINKLKEALDGFGGGTFKSVVDSLFGGEGPIDKIVELTDKVPQLMKAAEAISILGAAGSNYAMAKAEIKRRENVAKLKEKIAKDSGGINMDPRFSKSASVVKRLAANRAKLAALEGQAMAMPASSNIGGNLGKIEGLVSEILKMKKEAAKTAGGNMNISAPSVNRGGDVTQVNTSQKMLDNPFISAEIAASIGH